MPNDCLNNRLAEVVVKINLFLDLEKKLQPAYFYDFQLKFFSQAKVKVKRQAYVVGILFLI